jgi:hypothetical protein
MVPREPFRRRQPSSVPYFLVERLQDSHFPRPRRVLSTITLQRSREPSRVWITRSICWPNSTRLRLAGAAVNGVFQDACQWTHRREVYVGLGLDGSEANCCSASELRRLRGFRENKKSPGMET